MRPGPLAAAAVFAALAAGPAAAQGGSNCQAIARAPAPAPSLVRLANAAPSVMPAAADAPAVTITYVNHSTFRIVAPDGTTVVTDYAGWAGAGKTPDVATMNHAHSSHYTPFPDPAILHVLPGWSSEGGGAGIVHFLTVGEVLIRNVTTDIRQWGAVEENGNSIFIFEMAGLCLGHLGHLHQTLSDAQVAEIGRLDVVFVPIDGSYTMDQDAMMEVVKRLRAQVVIPMHWFSTLSLAEFTAETRADGLAIDERGDPTMTISLDTLPQMPTFVVLPSS